MTLEDLYRLLRSGHVQAQGIVDTIRVPLVVLDEHLCVVSANPAFFDTFRVTRDETVGESFLHLGSGQWNSPELDELLRRVLPKSAAIIGYEVVHRFPEIGPRTMLVSARRLVHPDNNSQHILVIFEDVTEQRGERTQQNLIMAEVKHRFKNFLSLVASLARQSPSDGISAEEYRDTLLGRIDALAEAELSVFGNERADLSALLSRLTIPYDGRVRVDHCPHLQLDPRQASSLSMILHELATNATKYGALSVPGGQVTLRPSIDRGQHQLTLEWQERGGPQAEPAPHKGFGCRLIEMIATQQLGGSADFTFNPEGLLARLSFPITPA